MSKRISHTLALALGAGALVLGSAGPALAASPGPVTTLPANAEVAANDSLSVSVADSPVCATGYVDLVSFNPGKGNRDVVTVAVLCADGTLTATVTPTGSAKKSTVVKFSSMVDGKKVTQSLVVHVTPAAEAPPTDPPPPVNN